MRPVLGQMTSDGIDHHVPDRDRAPRRVRLEERRQHDALPPDPHELALHPDLSAKIVRCGVDRQPNASPGRSPVPAIVRMSAR
jgi:hypothetical protein